MRRGILLICVFLLLGAPVWGQEVAEKKRVAVMNFDFSGVQRWWESPNWDIGAGISDLIVKELVRDGSYTVVERRALDAVLAEQNFSNSDRANASTAAQIGNVLGVDAMILGSITQFGVEKKKFGIGGIGGALGGFGGGKVGTQKGKAKVVIDARVVSTNTGEILAVAEGEGQSKRSGMMLGGFGAGGGGGGGGAIEMGSSDFRETILGEAVHAAVADLFVELKDARDRIPQHKRIIKGLVAYAEAGLIIINVGSSHGVREGDELVVSRIKDTIKDPATGAVLREISDELGTIRVTSVEDASAEAQVISGSGIQVGDLVKRN